MSDYYQKVWDLKVTSVQKIVLLVLAFHCDDEKIVVLSLADLERLTDCSRRTVARSLRELSRLGYIRKVSRFGERSANLANAFHVDLNA